MRGIGRGRMMGGALGLAVAVASDGPSVAGALRGADPQRGDDPTDPRLTEPVERTRRSE